MRASTLIGLLALLVIGIIPGLGSLRDGIIEELADVGAASGSVNQSYSIGGVQAHSSATADSVFADATDFCDGTATGGSNSRCLIINCSGASSAVERVID